MFIVYVDCRYILDIFYIVWKINYKPEIRTNPINNLHYSIFTKGNIHIKIVIWIERKIQLDGQIFRYSQMDRYLDIVRWIDIQIQLDGQIDRQINRQIDKWMARWLCRIDRQLFGIDRQLYRIDRQLYKQIDNYIEEMER